MEQRTDPLKGPRDNAKDIVSLKEYLESRLAGHHQWDEDRWGDLERRFTSIERALDLAAAAAKRQEDLTIARRYVTESQMETQLNQLNEKITGLRADVATSRSYQSNIDGRIWAVSVGITIMSIVISTVIKFI